MKLLVGLGNIGSQFEYTRHNVGFMVLDQLAEESWENSDKCFAFIQKINIAGQIVLLAKPTTMMNLSGKAVSRLAQYYKIAPEDIWIVYDELDLPLSRLKISTNSSNNGHNGAISIQQQLGHNRFWRFRVGIDARTSREIPGREYVLQKFDPDQHELLSKSVTQAVEAINLSLHQDLKAAMQKFNKLQA